MNNWSAFPLNVTEMPVEDIPLDPSLYLHELNLSQKTQDALHANWPYYQIELGGGVRTISAQMLDERTDRELLAIAGIDRRALKEIREAVAADPGVLSNMYPHVSHDEVDPLYDTFFGDTRYDGDGNPLPAADLVGPVEEAENLAASLNEGSL